MNYIEHEVIKFKRTNRLRKCDYKSLSKICHRNNYVILNHTRGKTFMLALGIWAKAQTVPSISVSDSDGNYLIFLKDDLSSKKRLFALAHEIGHIELEHTEETFEAEQEANEFAHYLLESWGNIKIF